MRVWQEIADSMNMKYKSTIIPESIRIRIALNRDNIREEIGLVNEINVDSYHRATPNNSMNLNNCYIVNTFFQYVIFIYRLYSQK